MFRHHGVPRDQDAWEGGHHDHERHQTHEAGHQVQSREDQDQDHLPATTV